MPKRGAGFETSLGLFSRPTFFQDNCITREALCKSDYVGMDSAARGSVQPRCWFLVTHLDCSGRKAKRTNV